jgi:hypothetical protein
MSTRQYDAMSSSEAEFSDLDISEVNKSETSADRWDQR